MNEKKTIEMVRIQRGSMDLAEKLRGRKERKEIKKKNRKF